MSFHRTSSTINPTLPPNIAPPTPQKYRSISQKNIAKALAKYVADVDNSAYAWAISNGLLMERIPNWIKTSDWISPADPCLIFD
jgi:hypothetical protein